MDQDFIFQTVLDRMTGSDRGQMLKAAIPYLPPKGQQILSVYEKSRELMNTISLFRGVESGVSACSAPAAEPMEALNDIRRFCYGKSRSQLDNVLNMMAVAQMFALMSAPQSKSSEQQKEDFT